MADPIIPTRAGTTATGIPSGVPRDDYTRTNVNVGAPGYGAVESRSGYGTIMLVAGVLVVIAILALFMFGDRGNDGQTPASDVTIDNTNVPAADPAPAPVVEPDPAPAPAPAPADPILVPDTGTADPVLPAPDPAAPANP